MMIACIFSVRYIILSCFPLEYMQREKEKIIHFYWFLLTIPTNIIQTL